MLLVEGVACQFECVATEVALETAAVKEEPFSTETLHHVNSVLTEDADTAASCRTLWTQRQEDNSLTVQILVVVKRRRSQTILHKNDSHCCVSHKALQHTCSPLL